MRHHRVLTQSRPNFLDSSETYLPPFLRILCHESPRRLCSICEVHSLPYRRARSPLRIPSCDDSTTSLHNSDRCQVLHGHNFRNPPYLSPRFNRERSLEITEPRGMYWRNWKRLPTRTPTAQALNMVSTKH